MHKALDVAEYFICRQDWGAGDIMSPLKLQKLLYLAQIESMVKTGEPLFSEDIQAWARGPVVCEVWEHYKDYTDKAIPYPTFSEDKDTDFSEEELEILEDVWYEFGEMSARHLENLIYQSPAWSESRQGLGAEENSTRVIALTSPKIEMSDVLREASKSML